MSISVLAAMSLALLSAGETGISLTFDQGMQTGSGVAPSMESNVRMAAGQTGMAAHFSEGSVLAYPMPAGYSWQQGTLSLWICPDWDSVNTWGDRFFWGVANPDGSGRTVLGLLGKDGQGVLYFGDDGALMGLAAPVDWRAGEWHQVTVCWDIEAHCRALYVDGQLRHHVYTNAGFPGDCQAFHVGSLPCATRWMGVMDGHEADAAIDTITLSCTADAPGFDLVREAAREDEKAITRNEQAKEKYRPGYEAAWERYLQGPSLDDVAARHMDAAWDDLAGMAAPLSQRIPIEPRYYSDVVYVHPDLSLALGRANDAYGLGIACGAPVQWPDMYTVTRALHNGAQPIVESRWIGDAFELTQTALTLLPDDPETVTGAERMYGVMHLSVRNTTEQSQTVPLYVLIGRMQGTQNTNYTPFLASGSRWLEPVMQVTVADNLVSIDGKPFLAYETKGAVEFLPVLTTETADPLWPGTVRNAVRCTFDLAPGEASTLDLVVMPHPEMAREDEGVSLRAVHFEAAITRAEDFWDRGLAPGMKLTTPEPRVNDVYRALIHSCLNNLRKNPDRPWHEPFQSPVWEGVWPWEYAHMIAPLCALGFHREIEPSLAFFTQRQSGIGPYAEPGRKPEGETQSAYGCYTGNFLLRWTCETGAVLWAMASKYRYSGDAAWLRENKDSILAAWDWVQGERMRTRRFDDSGEKVPYYGLLPKGRVHDWEGWHYFFFSDVFTWKGMSEMALAFQEAGLPESARLLEDAGEYQACLLEAVERAQTVDPATGAIFVPNLVPVTPDETGGLWWADGPSCMFSTGLLDARTDQRFADMFTYLQQTWGTMIGLTNRMDEPRELGLRNPFWYVNASERGYFQNFLARGEVEKALLVLYSNLAYGMSQDCFQTVERIHISDANYSPFQPNASGNGRLLDMLKRMVIDDQDPGVLWLLRGCPRRWFAPGATISVQDAPTYYGVMQMTTHAGENSIAVEITPPDGPKPVALHVCFRLPDGKMASAAFLNDQPAMLTDGVLIIPAEAAKGICRIRVEMMDDPSAN